MGLTAERKSYEHLSEFNVFLIISHILVFVKINI